MSSISEPSAITGFPCSPGRHERGGNAGDAALDLEAFLLENAGQVFRGFELLKAELAEAEDGIDHHLRLLLHAIDLAGQIGFHRRHFLRRDLLLGGGVRHHHEKDERYSDHAGSP